MDNIIKQAKDIAENTQEDLDIIEVIKERDKTDNGHRYSNKEVMSKIHYRLGNIANKEDMNEKP